MESMSTPHDQSRGIDRLWKAMQQKVGTLLQYWALYENLYMKEENVQRTNRCAGTAFAMIQTAIAHEVIHLISALCDPSQDGKKKANNSLLGIVELLKQGRPFNGGAIAAVESEIEELRKSSEALLHYRNKRVAHFDVDATLAVTPPKAIVKDVRRAVKRVREIIEQLHLASGDGEYSYEMLIDHSMPAGQLNKVIAEALWLRAIQDRSRQESTPDSVIRGLTLMAMRPGFVEELQPEWLDYAEHLGKRRR